MFTPYKSLIERAGKVEQLSDFVESKRRRVWVDQLISLGIGAGRAQDEGISAEVCSDAVARSISRCKSQADVQHAVERQQ